ncbi:hypothetical protein JXO52_16935 [bacterium]|nr:hypothetical protein [bacterium]
MASSLWDDLKKTLLDGVNTAADKTEEYTRIGKIKVDLLNLNRKLDQTYKALGREVYVRVSDGKRIDAHNDDGISYFIEKINHITAAITKNEKAIVDIREQARRTAEAAQKKRTPPAGRNAAPASGGTPESGKKPAAEKKPAPAEKKSAVGKPAGKTSSAKKPAAGRKTATSGKKAPVRSSGDKRGKQN